MPNRRYIMTISILMLLNSEKQADWKKRRIYAALLLHHPLLLHILSGARQGKSWPCGDTSLAHLYELSSQHQKIFLRCLLQKLALPLSKRNLQKYSAYWIGKKRWAKSQTARR